MAYTPLRDKPLCFVDVETSGLDPAKHEMLEFAVAFENGEGLSFKIKPEDIGHADPYALKVNGYTPEAWVGAYDFKEAAWKIAEHLKEHVLVGHNVKFDVGFINALLQKAGVKERVDYHCLDTVTLAYEHLVPCGLDSLSLKNVCRFLDIPEEPEKHEAFYGASACRQVYLRLVNATWVDRLKWRMRKGAKG